MNGRPESGTGASGAPGATSASSPAGAANAVPPPVKLKHILVPVDFSLPCRKALAYAVAFAGEFGATLSLLYVVEPVVYPSELGYAPVEVEVLSEVSQSAARQKLEELLAGVNPPQLRGACYVRLGRAHHEIVVAAQDLAAELIVIASHGHGALRHAVLGSTVERVLRHAPCPVFVVRERQHDFLA